MNSCLPSLAITDIKKMQERLKYLQGRILFPLIRIKDNKANA